MRNEDGWQLCKSYINPDPINHFNRLVIRHYINYRLIQEPENYSCHLTIVPDVAFAFPTVYRITLTTFSFWTTKVLNFDWFVIRDNQRRLRSGISFQYKCYFVGRCVVTKENEYEIPDAPSSYWRDDEYVGLCQQELIKLIVGGLKDKKWASKLCKFWGIDVSS